MKKYQELLEDVLENGEEKVDRTGTGTFSVFGRQVRYDLAEGFPLLTTKKLHIRSILHELRRKCERSNVATFRKRERDETISKLT